MKTKVSIETDVKTEPVIGTVISKNDVYVHIQTMDCRVMIPWQHIKLVTVIE